MSKTSLIVTGTIIALGIYDLYAVNFGGIDSSISRFLQNSAFDAPLVAFTFGFICGHCFGYFKPHCPKCRKDAKPQ